MRIDELDEFQGVTPQVIAEWMTRNGWKQTKPNWWARGEDGLMFDPQTFDQLWFWLKGLADVYTEGSQLAMLREINPRMRPWPSIEARRAHNGPWFALYVESRVIINGEFRPDIDVFASFSIHADILFESDDFARFWPCDAQGNKVRWPTDDNGNML